MSFVALFQPFQSLSSCVARLLPSRVSSFSASLFASWHEHETVPFLSISAVIVCALLANFFIVLPHVQPSPLSLAFYLATSLSACFTFLFLVLVRAVDPGVLRPSLSPPTPRTQRLLTSHQHWYVAPKRYARLHPHSDGTVTYTPVLSQLSTAAANGDVDVDSNDTIDDTGDEDEDSELVVQDWCFGCQIWRPPHAGHCRQCECCIQRFDHHCFVLGACIGRHNLLFFLLFLLASGVSGILLTSSSLIMTLQREPFSAASASEPLVWLGGLLTCSSLYIGATLIFLVYQIQMLCRNTTTREQHRSSHTELPIQPSHLTVSKADWWQQWRRRWRDVVWPPPGRRWKQVWVVDGKSERRRLMETRWRRERIERAAQQQYQLQSTSVREQSEASVDSRERLWKGDEGEEEETKERVVAADEDEVDNGTTMRMSSFLSDDDDG